MNRPHDPPDGNVIPAGQEELIRRLVAPSLPEGWTFLRASVQGSEVRARYQWAGPPDLQAELRLAHPETSGGGVRTERFLLRLLAPHALPSLAPLRAALLAAVRAAESAFVWARVSTPEPVSPSSTVRAPAPAPAQAEAAPEAEIFTTARATAGRGDTDGALAALAGFLAGAPRAVEARAAQRLRVEIMWRSGRYHEALTELDDALRRFPDGAALHATAAALRAELHDDERAAAHAREALARAVASPGLELQAAAVLLALGHESEARQTAARILAATPEAATPLLLDIAGLYRDAGDYAQADALYARVLARDPTDAPARLALGALCAWRGEAHAAHVHADTVLAAHPTDAPARCLRGAARMLTGEVSTALDDFDEATRRDPSDPVAAVWRGEALLRLGRPVEALAEIRRGGERSDDLANHVAAQILISLAQIQTGGFPGLPEYVLQPALDALLEGDAPGPPDTLEARLRDGLARLRGNRSPVATRVRADGSLERITVPPAPRTASKRALWRFVATASRDEALAELARIQALSPRAAEPSNYRGELFLYLGDTAAARREFEQAIALYRRSRWAYIGLGGVAVLEGNFPEALARLAEGVVLAGGPGPTTFVYRGEALRRLGRGSEARADLTHAVRHNPGRIGAWLNLGLLDAAEGDLAGARQTLATLRQRAPGFVADAIRTLPGERADAEEIPGIVALLETMLRMLRGNRGSSCVTYFTREGWLRAVPPFEEAENLPPRPANG